MKVEEASEELEYVFVDLASGEEIEQKESFTNEEEAQQVVDYITAYH